MDPKVITDVQPFLMTVLQGYRDHVHLCETLFARRHESCHG